jgi:hypothetical protein
MTTLSSLAIVTAKFFLSHQWLAKRIDLSEKDGDMRASGRGIS